MAESKDLYAILGVKRGATRDELRRAYRKLARQNHPDMNPGDKAAEERFKHISVAYEILYDPAKRKLYDEFGLDGLRTGFDANNAREYQAWARARDAGGARGGRGVGTGPGGAGGFDFDFDLGDLFGDLFAGQAGGARPRRGRSRVAAGADVLASVDVDLAQALAGTEVKLEVPGQDVVTVRIPPGADTGSRLRVAGRGAPGVNGGPPGDLVIETRVRPHPFFVRQGLDLRLRLPLTLAEAYGGTHVDVPTPTGTVKLRVPPLSQQGTELRLAGKGVRRGSERGDLFVILEVRLPDKDDADVRASCLDAERAYSAPVRAGLHL